MTWAEACRMMLKGKRVRLPYWNSWVTVGFGEKPYLNSTTRTDGYREFVPEPYHMISKLWELAERGPVPTPHPLDDWEFDVNTQKFTRITEAGNNVGIYIYSHEAGWGVLYDGGARVYGTLDDAIYIANRIAEANGGWADKEVEKETEGLLDEVLVEVET